jgi:transcriptional regulator with XRE-family HTH domain
MTPRERFGANLIEARKRSGITQQEVADRCYMHPVAISRLEEGSSEPSFGTIMKLVGVLGVTTEALCTGISWDEKAQRFECEGE